MLPQKFTQVYFIYRQTTMTLYKCKCSLLCWMAMTNENIDEELLQTMLLLLNNCEHTKMPGYCKLIIIIGKIGSKVEAKVNENPQFP